MRSFCIILLSILISSCATHSGMITAFDNTHSTEREYVDYAVGYSKASYFLGIGGIGQQTLIQDAKRKLYSRKLEDGEIFSNVTLDIKSTTIFPFQKREVFVFADIVKTGDAEISYSSQYLNEQEKYKVNSLQLNDNVRYYTKEDIQGGKVIDFKGGYAKLYVIDTDGNAEIQRVAASDLFKIDKSAEDDIYLFQVGESVEYLDQKGNKKQAEIIDTNAIYSVMKNASGEYFKFSNNILKKLNP